VPAQSVADARAGWSALRADAGEDAAQCLFEAIAATLLLRLEAAARCFEMGRSPNKKVMDSLVNDLVWRRVVGHCSARQDYLGRAVRAFASVEADRVSGPIR
jgi:hypothetical protein